MVPITSLLALLPCLAFASAQPINSGDLASGQVAPIPSLIYLKANPDVCISINEGSKTETRADLALAPCENATEWEMPVGPGFVRLPEEDGVQLAMSRGRLPAAEGGDFWLYLNAYREQDPGMRWNYTEDGHIAHAGGEDCFEATTDGVKPLACTQSNPQQIWSKRLRRRQDDDAPSPPPHSIPSPIPEHDEAPQPTTTGSQSEATETSVPIPDNNNDDSNDPVHGDDAEVPAGEEDTSAPPSPPAPAMIRFALDDWSEGVWGDRRLCLAVQEFGGGIQWGTCRQSQFDPVDPLTLWTLPQEGETGQIRYSNPYVGGACLAAERAEHLEEERLNLKNVGCADGAQEQLWTVNDGVISWGGRDGWCLEVEMASDGDVRRKPIGWYKDSRVVECNGGESQKFFFPTTLEQAKGEAFQP